LFVGIRNRYCVIFQRAKNKKLDPPEHTCFLNWKNGATCMEADGIADGFKQSIEMHGLKYNKLIGRYVRNTTFLNHAYFFNYLYNFSLVNSK